MKNIKSLSADYWIENTQQFYKDQDSDMHLSYFVMEAYEAGFNKALELAAKLTKYDELLEIADEDDGNGPSSYDQYLASKSKNKE